jgi:ribosomal protein L7Ae-like RNA K-turn-binding protein
MMTEVQKNMAVRVKLGIQRKQVAFGRDDVTKMGRRQQLALVWVTEDLARNAIFKLVRECESLDLPMIIWGDSETVGEITGEPSVKVYMIKRNFSGLKTLLHDLRAAGLLDA